MNEYHSLEKLHADQIMATSNPTEMQIESEMMVQKVVEELVEIEVEEGKEDPFEGMNNVAIADIYKRMKPEDRRLFRQFKKFHKTYYELHEHDAPSHQLGIVREIFGSIPVQDAETIAAAQMQLLAAERLKDLYRQLGLAVPTKLQAYEKPDAPEYPPPPPPLHFPSQQDNEKQMAHQQPQQAAEQDVKPDIKPPRRLATSYLGKLGLLCMIGTGDADHVITKVLPQTAPLQDYDEDNPANIITIDYETDESDDVDDLSEVSMTSTGQLARKNYRVYWATWPHHTKE